MDWKFCYVGLITSLIVGTNALPTPQTSTNGLREEQGIDPGLTTTLRPFFQTFQTPAPFDLVNNNNGFGIGAAAGFAGIGASAGLGSFSVDPKTDPFLPFGAFAGINLPNQAGRIGAGCTGLNCGVQLGEFVLQVPNFFAAFSSPNHTRQSQQQNSFSDAVGVPSSSSVDGGDESQSGANTKGNANATVIRNRNDLNNRVVDQATNNVIRTLLGGLRDFRTTLAGFFREPDNRTTQVQRTPQQVSVVDVTFTTPASTTTTTRATSPTTRTQETTPEVRENEVA